jgi:hypothetical protein
LDSLVHLGKLLIFYKKLFVFLHIVAVMLFLSAVLLFVYGQIFGKFSAEIQSNCNLAGPISCRNDGINWIHQWTDSSLHRGFEPIPITRSIPKGSPVLALSVKKHSQHG